MSRKKRTHLRGKRGQAFADKIRGIPLDHILCVSMDVHKYFHVVMLHNALGEMMTTTFEIDIFQAGFDQLCRAIDEAVARTNAQVVLVGMEPTGHYFENLARHLHQRPQAVTLINSFAVSRNREQQMMRREKDDEIDVGAVSKRSLFYHNDAKILPESLFLLCAQVDRDDLECPALFPGCLRDPVHDRPAGHQEQG